MIYAKMSKTATWAWMVSFVNNLSKREILNYGNFNSGCKLSLKLMIFTCEWILNADQFSA
jgi:hypothetical protein